MSRLEEFQSWGANKPSSATAREIVAHSRPMDFGTKVIDNVRYRMSDLGDEKDSNEAVMERKYKSAKDRGIADDIRRRGIVHPLRMSSGANENIPHFSPGTEMTQEHFKETGKDNYAPIPMVYNGQHRLAVMFHEQPDKPIALEWDDPKGKWTGSNKKYNKMIPPTPRVK